MAETRDIPVLLLTYRRPDTTRRLVDRLRAIRPKRIFYAADAPKAGEEDLCSETRSIADTINWPCDVHRNFRKQNEGLRRSVDSSLDWFFDQVHEGIVLEDDCVPGPDFFRFCAEMLDRYREDRRVAHIGGTCHDLSPPVDLSYRFSHYPHIWGWATWAGSWRQSRNRPITTVELERSLRGIGASKNEVDYWLLYHDCVKLGKIDTWDFDWLAHLISNDALGITPSRNLVSNIGFGENATHTTRRDSQQSARVAESLKFPLTHPPSVASDVERDRDLADNFYGVSRSARIGHAKLRLTKVLPVSAKRILKKAWESTQYRTQ